MPDQTKPMKVSANAGRNDFLTAAGRYLVVIMAVLPALLIVLGTRDVLQLIAFFQTEDGIKFAVAVSGLISLIWGLKKTHGRGAQIASAAADPRVSDKVLTLKK